MCIRLFCMCKHAFSVVYCTHIGFLKTQGLYTIHKLSFSLQNARWEITPIGICRLPCYFSWQHSIPSYSCGVAASKTPRSHLEEGWGRGLSEFVTLPPFRQSSRGLMCVLNPGSTSSPGGFLKHGIMISRVGTGNVLYILKVPQVSLKYSWNWEGLSDHGGGDGWVPCQDLKATGLKGGNGGPGNPEWVPATSAYSRLGAKLHRGGWGGLLLPTRRLGPSGHSLSVSLFEVALPLYLKIMG